MGSIRVYIKPFLTTGNYAADYIDVTADVSRESISSISKSLDNSDFDVGVFSNSDFSFAVNNQSGIYNDVDSITSIFAYRRSNSLVKVTWLFGETEPICGFAVAGEAILGPEEIIYEGLLDDTGSTQDIKSQLLTFNVLGLESVFAETEISYNLLANGMTVKQVLDIAMTAFERSEYLIVNTDNIVPANNFVIDDISGFENNTIREVLDELLVSSNSVLTIIDREIFITSREESADLKYTFYGQASLNGVENIANIQKYRIGVNRLFNFWTWENTSLVSKSTSSITNYGVKKKQVNYSYVTNSTTQQSILDEQKNSYSVPRIEFALLTPLTIENQALEMLDKVNVDYPTNTIPVDGSTLPIIGIAKYGHFKVPFSEYSITLAPTQYFKIIGKEIDLNKEEIIFTLREVD